MVTALTKQGRKLAKQSLTLQISMVIFVAVVIGLVFNAPSGVSALIGGSIVVIANAVFSFCTFIFGGGQAIQQIAISFYVGEVLKIGVTIALFMIVFMYDQREAFINVIPLGVTYLLVLGTSIFAPVLFVNNK